MFNQGDSVECVNGYFPPCYDNSFVNTPKQGVVYTVRSCESDSFSGLWLVKLEEIHNPGIRSMVKGEIGLVEPGFSHLRFKKIS
jgi:hypothetical protein